ncbi:hypothetical protein NE237_001259 [Protea cynaroides]|uniref:Uncharacterized protein n=1 Tax=Protea cynaroides TaxID=273540 RepID=A0A9Q0QXY4_9MAGN|nr:hypothetical protein NE237_001259 [Protea cynaroides]
MPSAASVVCALSLSLSLSRFPHDFALRILFELSRFLFFLVLFFSSVFISISTFSFADSKSIKLHFFLDFLSPPLISTFFDGYLKVGRRKLVVLQERNLSSDLNFLLSSSSALSPLRNRPSFLQNGFTGIKIDN